MRLPSLNIGTILHNATSKIQAGLDVVKNTIASIVQKSTQSNSYSPLNQSSPLNFGAKITGLQKISLLISKIQNTFARTFQESSSKTSNPASNKTGIEITKKTNSKEEFSKEDFHQLLQKNTNSKNVRNAIKILLRKDPTLLTLEVTKQLIEDPNYHQTLLDLVRTNPGLLKDNYPTISLLTLEDLEVSEIQEVVKQVLDNPEIDGKNYLSANIIYSIPKTMYLVAKENASLEVMNAVVFQLKDLLKTPSIDPSTKKEAIYYDLSKTNKSMVENPYLKKALITLLNRNRSNIINENPAITLKHLAKDTKPLFPIQETNGLKTFNYTISDIKWNETEKS